MLNLSLKELKLIAKNRDIRGYKKMSKDKLLIAVKEPKTIKNNPTKNMKNVGRLKRTVT